MKTYVTTHKGHKVPFGSSRYIADSKDYIEGFLKKENNIWLFLAAKDNNYLGWNPHLHQQESFSGSVELPVNFSDDPDDSGDSFESNTMFRPKVGESVAFVQKDDEYLYQCDCPPLLIPQGSHMIVVGTFYRHDNGSALVTLMAKDTINYDGFVTINPDFLKPFKTKEYERVINLLSGAIRSEEFTLENVSSYLSDNDMLK